MNEDDDDSQAQFAQDPGYALHMLHVELAHVTEVMQKEHSESLEQYMKMQEFEEDLRIIEEKEYWHE